MKFHLAILAAPILGLAIAAPTPDTTVDVAAADDADVADIGYFGGPFYGGGKKFGGYGLGGKKGGYGGYGGYGYFGSYGLGGKKGGFYRRDAETAKVASEGDVEVAAPNDANAADIGYGGGFGKGKGLGYGGKGFNGYGAGYGANKYGQNYGGSYGAANQFGENINQGYNIDVDHVKEGAWNQDNAYGEGQVGANQYGQNYGANGFGNVKNENYGGLGGAKGY
ncbi:hypothetical protein HDU87_003543 [Geranomyces variabilis]|uniref:Uncharacterized protein n=1 Tax=Geranomyces variabilis TaxID=109894 RepID=A0AAD5TKM4_9FUNG|nr:hypothetical protein HDU87_003543 [Geranomyces variabilis]